MYGFLANRLGGGPLPSDSSPLVPATNKADEVASPPTDAEDTREDDESGAGEVSASASALASIIRSASMLSALSPSSSIEAVSSGVSKEMGRLVSLMYSLARFMSSESGFFMGSRKSPRSLLSSPPPPPPPIPPSPSPTEENNTRFRSITTCRLNKEDDDEESHRCGMVKAVAPSNNPAIRTTDVVAVNVNDDAGQRK